MKGFSVVLLLLYEVFLIIDYSRYVFPDGFEERLIYIIPIVICLILGL